MEQKERLGKKTKGLEAAFSDDGFALGLAYILKLLNQNGQMDALHWFDSVTARLKGERQKLAELAKSKNDEDKQTLQLSLTRLNNLEAEFEMLFFSFSGARVFFREADVKKKDPAAAPADAAAAAGAAAPADANAANGAAASAASAAAGAPPPPPGPPIGPPVGAFPGPPPPPMGAFPGPPPPPMSAFPGPPPPPMSAFPGPPPPPMAAFPGPPPPPMSAFPAPPPGPPLALMPPR